MFLSEWREFPSAPCIAGKKNLMTASVSMLLKSRVSLTCLWACFLPGRTKTYQHHRTSSQTLLYYDILCRSCLVTWLLFCMGVKSGLLYQGADNSLARSGRKQARKHVQGSAILTTSRRELSSSYFFPLQGKAPKEIRAILTETLACFLPGRAKDLSVTLY